MDHDKHVDEKLKRKRELARLRVRKYRRKKRIAHHSDSVLQNKEKRIQISQNKLERTRELTRLRGRRYRDKKRLSQMKTELANYNSGISKPPNQDLSLLIENQRTEIQYSKVLEKSPYVDIHIDIKDEPVNVNEAEMNQMSIDIRNEQIDPYGREKNCTELRQGNSITEAKQENNLAPSDENLLTTVDDDSESCGNEVAALPDLNPQHRPFVFVDVELLESEDITWDKDYDV